MRIKTIGLAAALAVSVAGTAWAQAPKSQLSAADKSFLTEAMQGDLAEIEVGKLAEQKGASEQTKQFGNTLVSDHSANLDKAKSVAQTAGVTVPSGPNAQQKSMYDRLNKLSGDQFDKAFAKDMVEDHQKDISKFEKESKGSGAVAEFAKETLPALRKHLEMAQGLTRATTGSSR